MKFWRKRRPRVVIRRTRWDNWFFEGEPFFTGWQVWIDGKHVGSAAYWEAAMLLAASRLKPKANLSEYRRHIGWQR